MTVWHGNNENSFNAVPTTKYICDRYWRKSVSFKIIEGLFFYVLFIYKLYK